MLDGGLLHKNIIFLFALFFCLSVFATDLNNWIQKEYLVSQQKIFANISPADGLPGVVIASPSRQDPNYYFHWVRDAALVFYSLINDAHFRSSEISLDDYLYFSRRVQLAPSLSGLGEPRFNVDGSAFNGLWARPQNDGPALRVLTLLHFLEIGVHQSQREKINEIIETDIAFILSHAAEASFDIWEEIRADHFYTRIVQMAALKKGILHFDVNWKISIFDCEAVRAELENALNKHWLSEKNYFSISLNRTEGGANKVTDLDTAVILGALHAGLDQDFYFSVRDEKILATAQQLENTFQNLYEINQNLEMAPAIGRYADDVYFGGNPWYLTTLAYAELHYRLAKSLLVNPDFLVTELNISFLKQAWNIKNKTLEVGLNIKNDSAFQKLLIKSLIDRGDQFIETVRLHTTSEGSMSEQFSRKNGYALSARDLTWSYASFLTAVQTRNEILNRVVQ